MTSTKNKGLKTTLGHVLGKGSAHNGTHHWWAQRLTAMMMVPLLIVIIIGFINTAVFGAYSDIALLLQSPVFASFILLFLALGFHHGTNGLQVVFEDYIGCSCTRTVLLLVVRFIAVVSFIIGAMAVLQISILGMLSHV